MARTKKQWRDLTPTQRMRIVLVGSLQLLLLVAALSDIRRRAATEINGGKRLWTALAFVNGIGPIAYFVLGRKRSGTEVPERLAA
ncbi:MAG TPA: PLDc N-terminal domain-containing protein [Chloroflexota bacterium]|nr:PLDc N-terminal domain-containing protein [Chloroflexota bacterium]